MMQIKVAYHSVMTNSYVMYITTVSTLLFSVVCFGVLAKSCAQVNPTANYTAKDNHFLLSLAVRQLVACIDRHNTKSHTTGRVSKSKYRNRYALFSNRRLPKPITIAYAPMSLVLLLIHLSGESLGCVATTSCPSKPTLHTHTYDEHTIRQTTARSTHQAKLQTSTMISVPKMINQSTIVDSLTTPLRYYQTLTIPPVIKSTCQHITQYMTTDDLVTTPTTLENYHILTPPPVTVEKTTRHRYESSFTVVHDTSTGLNTYRTTIPSYPTLANTAHTGPYYALCQVHNAAIAAAAPHNIAARMIALSGDIESNPGPVKFPCGICTKAVRSNQCSVACDSCDQWFHKRCMCMKTVVFENLRNVSWYCDTCGVPNFTDSFFADLEIDHQNTFAHLSDSSNSLSSLNSSAELAGPTAMSSPISRKQIHHQTSKHLKLLNINTQSINNKKADLLSIIAQSQPDIIVATETWLF